MDIRPSEISDILKAQIQSVSDSALTWFFVGLVLIAAIAAVLGQAGID